MRKVNPGRVKAGLSFNTAKREKHCKVWLFTWENLNLERVQLTFSIRIEISTRISIATQIYVNPGRVLSASAK